MCAHVYILEVSCPLILLLLDMEIMEWNLHPILINITILLF